MTFTDSYGRDLAWLRANHPATRPGRIARIINVFWPLPSVELWDAWEVVEQAAVEWDDA